MLFLRLILVLAIGASVVRTGESIATAAAPERDEHACCHSREPAGQQDDGQHKDCGGACLMTCCRTVTAPADPVATPLDVSHVAVRIVLPPLLADDLGEPQSIFHPPRT